MKIISTTYELCHGAYIYRLIEDNIGVIIKRVPADNAVWNHGIICQILNESGTFKHACGSDTVQKVSNLKDAIVLIKGF